jgi:hypothetical protein
MLGHVLELIRNDREVGSGRIRNIVCGFESAQFENIDVAAGNRGADLATHDEQASVVRAGIDIGQQIVDVVKNRLLPIRLKDC